MRLTKRIGYFNENPIYSIIAEPKEAFVELNKAVQKLGQLEDIEERLSKYKEIGIDGLIDLFKNLTDEDIEYVVQLAFKKRKIVYDIR